MPATVELRDEKQDNFFLHFGDIESLEESKIVQEALFIEDFSNPIDSKIESSFKR